MGEKKPDGGNAFPSQHPNIYDGMSLRDWFAGMALPERNALDAIG